MGRHILISDSFAGLNAQAPEKYEIRSATSGLGMTRDGAASKNRVKVRAGRYFIIDFNREKFL